MREVADTTRELTGRCQVVLAAIAADGTVEDFVTSGMSAAEHATLAERSDGPRLFEHFRDLERPLHIPDLRAFVRDLGVLPDRSGGAHTIARALEAGAADYVVQPFSSIRADRAHPVDPEPHHPAQTVRLRRTLHGLERRLVMIADRPVARTSNWCAKSGGVEATPSWCVRS